MQGKSDRRWRWGALSPASAVSDDLPHIPRLRQTTTPLSPIPISAYQGEHHSSPNQSSGISKITCISA
jgi:hypothetical protein